MPIYEYECRGCHEEFELLVLKDTVPACPACQSQDLERLLSGFAVNSPEMSRARVRKARNAMRNSRDFKDKQIAEAEEVRDHLNEHREEAGVERLGPLRAKKTP